MSECKSLFTLCDQLFYLQNITTMAIPINFGLDLDTIDE